MPGLKKCLVFFFCFLLIVISITGLCFQLEGNVPLIIHFNSLTFETYDYDPSEVTVHQSVDDEVEIAEIVDIETNEKLETMKVEKNDEKLEVIDGPYTFTRDKVLDQAIVRVSINADIYASDSVFRIDSINESNIFLIPQFEEGDLLANKCYIEDGFVTAYSDTGDFPTSKMNYTASGNLTIALDNTIGVRVGSPKFLGFCFESKSTSTSYIREYFSFSGTIDCVNE